MGSEYDLKFEEMKKYMPLLDGLIRRLEETNSKATGNPRQAQIDKIRSLRELLEKKRIKMENLHKCEQLLANLYAKVESQNIEPDTDDDPFSIDSPEAQENSDLLEAEKNKLKTMAKRQEDGETLPEILRVDEVEEMHTAGSKKPALFQRRPNKSSESPTHRSPTKIKEENVSPQSSASSVSPDISRRRWSTTDSAEEKPLFSRRSPRTSPTKNSPSYHKNERKKSTRKSKDLNITLNVPEDIVSGLNTKDIFTRIINCKDGDVDIDTLRELRKQIFTALKRTGARDDISELILKSYNKNKETFSRKEEVEEGDLSDSERRERGSLSGNLVLKDQVEANTSTDKDKASKIQIILVINSDKNNPDPNTSAELVHDFDVSELEMYDNESKALNKTGCNKEENEQDVIKLDDDDSITTVPDRKKNIKEDTNSTDKETSKNNATDEKLQQPSDEEKIVITPKEATKYRANFYKPSTDSSEPLEENIIQDSKDASAQVETQKGTDIKTDSNIETTVSEVPETS